MVLDCKANVNDLPLNILPTDPSLENMLVPVPWVLSPALGYSVSAPPGTCRERSGESYDLVDGLVDSAGQLLVFGRRVGTLLERLCGVISVHCSDIIY